MARLDVNRSGEMEVFVRVVDLGGFSAAARAFRMTPSAVSKLIARLETRLGTRLINRSTRALQLTAEGSTFYQRALKVLAELDEAERLAGSDTKISGRIRLNTNASFHAHILAPVLPLFIERYPEVTLDLVLTDTVIDLLQERTDVVVRAGPLKNSALMARKLGETRMLIVGAPAYFQRHGEPQTPQDLQQHHRLGFGYARAVKDWPLRHQGRAIAVPMRETIQASDGEALRHLAIAGAGLARLAAFTVRDDIAAGHLKPVLEKCLGKDVEEVHALYIGSGGPVPARIRALLDFLAKHARVD
ncbi:MAG TPA: LysR family transcriptional regulator [Dongiaceae bacterium]|nr:LysR family transcriptional regulator [Dongiaceae bacterium]